MADQLPQAFEDKLAALEQAIEEAYRSDEGLVAARNYFYVKRSDGTSRCCGLTAAALSRHRDEEIGFLRMSDREIEDNVIRVQCEVFSIVNRYFDMSAVEARYFMAGFDSNSNDPSSLERVKALVKHDDQLIAMVQLGRKLALKFCRPDDDPRNKKDA